MIENLTTASPVAIDTELARLYDEHFEVGSKQMMLVDDLERTAHRAQGKTWREDREPYSPEYIDRLCNDGSLPIWERRSLRDLDTRLTRLRAKAAALREEMAPLNAEYRRRPWTRAFLAVTNSQGHVHSSMECSTCNKGESRTRFSWMVEWSGADEATIVADAGERACTVCYPSAPAEVLNRPTKMFSEDEKAKQRAREEREAKRNEREAAKITLTVPETKRNYRTQEEVTRPREVTWKTTRALQNDTSSLVRQMHGSWAMIHGFDIPTEQDAREQALEVMLAALKERGVDTEALVAKNIKRAQKER